MENSTNAVFDRAKRLWSTEVLNKQQSKHNPQSSFTFTNNIDYIANNAQIGQIHFVISSTTLEVMPTLSIHKKILMNNGKSILTSEFINYTTTNQREFTSKTNWFSYDDFVNMVDKMDWIKYVNCNEGKKNNTTMNILDFKKFMNNTFKMKFKIENNNTDEKQNQSQDRNNENNNNSNHENKTNNKQQRSKFFGQNKWNYKNQNINKNQRQRQLSIMEAMGARLREMVTPANTNNIHSHIKRPIIPIARTEKEIIKTFYSDNYGFSKYKFYNPFIKEFSIELIGNLMCIYRSKINPQRPNFARDLKTAITRAAIGKACIFIEENIFIPFKRITHDMVQFNIGDPIEKSSIPNGLTLISSLLRYFCIRDPSATI